MSAFVLVSEGNRIIVRPAEPGRKAGKEWEIRRDRDVIEVRCEPGKLIPALAYLLAEDLAEGEWILQEREWLVYPSPFRWHALPAERKALKALLLDPRRLWLDSLLRTLTERARDRVDQTVVDDVWKAVSGGLGGWIAQALENAWTGGQEPSSQEPSSQEPPWDGMNKDFREVWLRKHNEIMGSRKTLLDALLEDLGRPGTPADLEAQASVVVHRVFRAGDALTVYAVSPFDPALNIEPQPNETRVVVVRTPAGGVGQAFWLAYHIAQIAVVTLPNKSLLGFHNAWTVPGGTFRETEEFESEDEALERALSEIMGKGGG